MSGLANLTSFPAALSVGRDARGQMQVTVSLKPTFTWDRSGTAIPAPATALREQDELAGDGPNAGLVAAAEVGPPKPKVDVLLAGRLAFRSPLTEANLALAVGNRLRKIVQVVGDRVWQSGGGKLAPSRPRAVTRVPIQWERAFGGSDAADSSFFEPRNPAGSGFGRRPQDLQGRPAPNFEDPRQPITSFKDRPAPCAFGPIAAHWQPRVKLGGTYDDKWKNERCPLLPADFDPAFFNLAPLDQQLPSYLVGESVRLDGMTENGFDTFTLPALKVAVAFRSRTDMLQTYTRVDTVVIEPEEKSFSIIARAAYLPKPNVLAMRQVVVGALTPGRRRALSTGKLYVDLRTIVSGAARDRAGDPVDRRRDGGWAQRRVDHGRHSRPVPALRRHRHRWAGRRSDHRRADTAPAQAGAHRAAGRVGAARADGMRRGGARVAAAAARLRAHSGRAGGTRGPPAGSNRCGRRAANRSPRSRVIARGKDALPEALAVAEQMLAARQVLGCYLVGLDSLIAPRRLRRLARAGLVLDGVNSDGFVPGEGAGALLLVPRRDKATMAVIAGTGSARDAGLANGEAATGRAIGEAIDEALAGAYLKAARVSAVVHDLSGQYALFEELALAAARPPLVSLAGLKMIQPAFATGELGAASGVLALAAAAFFLARGVAREAALALFTSDGPSRSAAVLVRERR